MNGKVMLKIKPLLVFSSLSSTRLAQRNEYLHSLILVFSKTFCNLNFLLVTKHQQVITCQTAQKLFAQLPKIS